ncbi:MAG: phosphoribosyltransferase [Cytophagaceae bacterium SCN 52-12]|mgnify:CR=1 FL=1|nr:MAG: phosphoribosyltransferase [Cytophagaceae bacterium SCN 52-12]
MSAIEEPQKILTPLQIGQKIRRMAYEVYERNFTEKEIVIAGIVGEGYEFAKRLAAEISRISPMEVRLIELRFDVHAPKQSYIDFGNDEVVLEDHVVVVADVVLNTARTMTFSLQPFLQKGVRKLQVAVVVDRSHRLYPVSADYVGYSLSTTINEHVQVILSKPDQEGAYLQ